MSPTPLKASLPLLKTTKTLNGATFPFLLSLRSPGSWKNCWLMPPLLSHWWLKTLNLVEVALLPRLRGDLPTNKRVWIATVTLCFFIAGSTKGQGWQGPAGGFGKRTGCWEPRVRSRCLQSWSQRAPAAPTVWGHREAWLLRSWCGKGKPRPRAFLRKPEFSQSEMISPSLNV